MATPNLFPLLLKAQAGALIIVEDVLVTLDAEPDVTVDDDVEITLDDDDLEIVLDDEVVVAVD